LRVARFLIVRVAEQRAFPVQAKFALSNPQQVGQSLPAVPARYASSPTTNLEIAKINLI